MEVMKKCLDKSHKIHLHCFTESQVMAKKCIEEFDNLFIGFTGNVSFLPKVESVVKFVPLDRIVLETGNQSIRARFSS